MKVNIKKFNVEMPVKSSGIEFEIRSTDDKTQLGDCYLTMKGLTWCAGKTTKKMGIAITWQEFMAIMKSSASADAAVKAATKA